MARGDMKVVTSKITPNVEILNRIPFEGVPMTIDFSSVTDKDAETGEKVVKAGTPVDKDGKPQKTTPFTGAVGILLDDVYESRPQGTILKRAYVNTKRAQDNSGKTYDAALVAALINAGCNIIFGNHFHRGIIFGDLCFLTFIGFMNDLFHIFGSCLHIFLLDFLISHIKPLLILFLLHI